jgi:hypothetical protein
VIIGLSGYARSGKDESANALQDIGFQRVAFADKLREFIYRLNPIVPSPVWGEHRRLADVIDEFGWNGYKASKYGKEIRELLQRLGTECGRELINDTIWVDAALGAGSVESNVYHDSDGGGLVMPRNIVVTDVRFPNEFAAIKARGGYVVRIVRPGVGPANSHPSETALDGFDFDVVIHNNGTIGDLHRQMQDLALHSA